MNDSADFLHALKTAARKVEQHLKTLLPAAKNPDQRLPEDRLIDAMNYALYAGGKRLRPFFVLETAKLFNVKEAPALQVAAALEMAHTYSLVHDDLPAMDDDDIRRGKPSLHKNFDEATAILAGNGLLSLAFETLSEPHAIPHAMTRCELIHLLAHAVGARGMIGGQMIDLQAEHAAPDLALITRLQRMKTGALISFACEAGAILGNATEDHRHALLGYAHDLGLAFQIADDLLDTQADPQTLGKSTGKDKKAGKATFVSALGAVKAREQAQILINQAITHLNGFGPQAEPLRQAASFIINRKN